MHTISTFAHSQLMFSRIQCQFRQKLKNHYPTGPVFSWNDTVTSKKSNLKSVTVIFIWKGENTKQNWATSSIIRRQDFVSVRQKEYNKSYGRLKLKEQRSWEKKRVNFSQNILREFPILQKKTFWELASEFTWLSRQKNTSKDYHRLPQLKHKKGPVLFVEVKRSLLQQQVIRRSLPLAFRDSVRNDSYENSDQHRQNVPHQLFRGKIVVAPEKGAKASTCYPPEIFFNCSLLFLTISTPFPLSSIPSPLSWNLLGTHVALGDAKQHIDARHDEDG